jgi:glycosyltransferase involved in cell wall biosynthesis
MESKQKILYVITKSVWGGAQRYVFDLATNLPKEKFEILVATGGNGPLIKKLEDKGIPVLKLSSLERDISFFKELRSFIELVRIMRNFSPDIVHLNSSKAGGLGALAARLARVKKIVFTAHGWAFNESRNILAKTLIWVASYITALLCTDIIVIATPELRSAQHMPFVGKKTTLIYNGVAPFPLMTKTESREKLGIGDGFWIGTIAELHPNKNLTLLIEAVSKIPDAKLCIIGEGEQRSLLEKQIKNLKLGEQILLTGFVENAREYLNAFDIFILPSMKEGLPYVLLEAGLSGLPVIASRVGGIPDIIEDGITGTLVNSGDTQQTINAIKKYLNSPNLKAQHGTTIKIKVEKTFSFEKLLTETENLYSGKH